MSGSLAIISIKVGLDRGGGDIGFNSPAVSAELNFVKLEVKELREVWPLMGGVGVVVNSMSNDGFSNSNCWQIMQSSPHFECRWKADSIDERFSMAMSRKNLKGKRKGCWLGDESKGREQLREDSGE